MVVLVICKKEEDSIKNEGAMVFPTLCINFSDPQGQITPEFELIQAFMHVLYTYKNEADSIEYWRG